MNVKPHHPLQEAIGRMLFGIEDVPPEVAKRMVSQAARMAVEYVQKTEAERDRLREALQLLYDTHAAPVRDSAYITYRRAIELTEELLQEASDEVLR